ncbi:MAG: hypothetical protein FWC36_02800 [Spirochaetes bacterium]|nr:hypothetical protein [Spirochaetota bacterium]
MVKDELINRSPLRILEKLLNGGLGKGNIGVLASKKGIGKTAFLANIATDKLCSDKPVIHVSFYKRTDHIISRYEDIFNEISKEKNLQNAAEISEEITRNRVIMNFNQQGIDVPRILSSMEALITGGNFKADTVIIDGFKIKEAGEEGLKAIKKFAQKLGLEIWISASLRMEGPVFNDAGIPYEIENLVDDFIDVLLTLKYDNQKIQMDIVKGHDGFGGQHSSHLYLDPKTLLVAAE